MKKICSDPTCDLHGYGWPLTDGTGITGIMIDVRKGPSVPVDPWADQPWATPAPGEPTDGGCE
jgi:hypothetical protein